MSPASQGGLEVTHYIGSSLISASARVVQRGSYGKGRKDLNSDYLLRNGRGGYPMPGMFPPCDCTGFHPRGGMGWAGVPFIAMAPQKQNKRGPGLNKSNVQHQPRKPTDDERTPLSRLAIHTQGAPLILSGKCNNQRKPQYKSNRGDLIVRRNNKYKDGRGTVGPSDSLSVASDESSGSGNSENCLPRIIKPRKRRKKDRKGNNPPESEESVLPPVEVAPRSQNGAAPDDPQLHHRFEDVAESEVACPLSSCQCHYCDPSGIWDAPAPDLVLRRSWSEPLPSVSKPLQRSYSLREEVSWESLKGCDISVKPSEARTQCLEVSTEIVTSPNGHRDLEIRFYSASPPS